MDRHNKFSSRHDYWNDVYIKLLRLKNPGFELFHFQFNRKPDWKPWEKVHPTPKLLPDRKSAIALARRTAKLFKGQVRLTTDQPFKESGHYFLAD